MTAAAVVVQSTVPDESVTVTVVPGLAVPETGDPSLGLTTGASMAAVSTAVVTGVEALPAGSVTVTVMGVPLAGTGAGVQLNVPAAVAVVEHRVVPAASFTVTVEPGSAEPVTGEPSVTLTTGAAGATVSLVVVVGVDTLPVGSVAVTVNGVPLAGAVAGIHVNAPVPAAATAVHNVVPAGSFTVTVEPGSAMPVIGEPSVGLTTGATGAAESTTTGVGVEMFPAGSVAVTSRVAPLAGTGIGLHEYVPSAAAVVVQSSVPSGSRTVIVEPGTAVPETGEPSVIPTAGAAGATPSTVVVAEVEVLPAGSVAVIDSTVASAGTGDSSQL